MNMNTTVSISEFELNQMIHYPSILIIGTQHSGKSTLCDYLCQYINRQSPSSVHIYSGNEFLVNNYYGVRYPKATIRSYLKTETIREILEETTDNLDRRTDKNKIVIIDECLYNKDNWTNNGSLLELVMNGRYYQITTILAIQTPPDITPYLRLNFDYVFVMDDCSYTYDLHKNFFPLFPLYENFRRTISKIFSNPYKSLVIDTGKRSENIFDKIYWFKAQINQPTLTALPSLSNNDDQEFNFDQSKNNTLFCCKNTCKNTHQNTHQNTRASIIDEITNNDTDTETDWIDTTNNNLKMEYHDDDYRLTCQLSDNNSDLIKIICHHIETIKNVKTEQMRLINENLKIKISLEKN